MPGGGREKKRLRRKKWRFPMLLHAQRDAPTSGCFTPNPTRFRRETYVAEKSKISYYEKRYYKKASVSYAWP
ncbi:hypothetical protein ACSQ67_026036 [Phaseolus vulgaris]